MPDLTTLTGVGVSPGVGAGPVVRVVDSVPEPTQGPGTGTPEEEYAAAAKALEDVAADLEDRGQRAGGEAQHVLEAQAMMARDPDLAVGIKQRTDGGSNAARAAYDAFGATREVLLTLGEYFAARVTDLDDIRNRTVALLLDVPAPGIPELKEPSILVAMDLAPADTALIDKSMVLAFATQEGGPTSHTSILARNLGIPAVVGCPGVRELAPGTYVMVDGSAGKVVIDPPVEMVAELAGRDEKRRAALAAVGNAPGATADGHAVPLLANIGGQEDVAGALANGAEGVGLFRSELLFLDRTDAPSEDEQYGLYRAVLEGFAGKKVVVRTLDAGADKPLPFLPFGEEPNPSMGVRGLRICMQAPDIMHTQLHALARAAEGLDTELWVMAPMVADVYEATWFKRGLQEGRPARQDRHDGRDPRGRTALQAPGPGGGVLLHRQQRPDAVHVRGRSPDRGGCPAAGRVAAGDPRPRRGDGRGWAGQWHPDGRLRRGGLGSCAGLRPGRTGREHAVDVGRRPAGRARGPGRPHARPVQGSGGGSHGGH